MRLIFTSPNSAKMLADPGTARFARSSVADLRATSARYPNDPGLTSFIDELLRASPEFAELWAEHEVEVHRVSTKRMPHPRFGELEVDCQILPMPDTDQRLVLYIAKPGSAAQKAFRQLASEITDDIDIPVMRE